MSKVDDLVDGMATRLIKKFNGIPFALVVHDEEDGATTTCSNVDADGVKRLLVESLLKINGPPHKTILGTDQGDVVINPDPNKDNN